MPDGLNELSLNSVPIPAIKISVGLPCNFEGTLRLLTKTKNEDTTGKLFGLGIIKEFSNWFGLVDKTPL